MKIAFAMYTIGLAGGVRAIFEVANRLHERGHDIRIIALGGDHSWYKVKAPIYYVNSPGIFSLGIKTYKLLRHAKVRNINASYFDVVILMKRLGLHTDTVKVLAEAIIEHGVDVVIATWYPTALSVWLSNVSKPLYFMQDFHELVQEADGVYGLRLFETTLRLPFHFLANSTYTRDIILSYNKEARVTVTGVGVDLNTFYVVSLAFTLSVTRRFPTEDLVALTVFNTGFSIVCDAWLRDCVVSAIFAKQPERYAELAGVAWSYLYWRGSLWQSI